MSLHNELLRSILEIPEAFSAILGTDPLSIALAAVGSLLFGVIGLLGGYMALGVLLQAVTPTGETQTWRPTR